MKTLPAGLQAHLDSGATTLCYCWKLTRGDGTVLGFTEHDIDLTFDGVTFTASGGFTATQLVQNLGVSVDNMNVDGALSDSSLSEDDLAGGRYDGASVELWRVNWQDVSQRLLMNSATLGEVTRNGSSFSAELRGLTHKLGQKTGRTFQRTCGAKLGDSRCGVDLSLSQYHGTGQVDAIDSGRVFTAIGINSFASDWFTAGLLTFSDGANVGLAFEVKRHLKKSGSVLVELWQRPLFDVAPADGFTITAGCKQMAGPCHDKFDNIANFRGFNLMPGPDAVLFYPKRGGGQDGGSLVGN
ncbi:MAG: DUF2163 domain-containing protein [Rhizobium sp.]|nr:DUF2163 domain-containing protein [Rhizobium sp.]